MDALPSGAPLQSGAFVVEATLARSGFGLTYRARDETLRREVALKEFFPSGCRRDPATRGVVPAGLLSSADFAEGRARFLQEARALALFRHPNIVAVHSFFEENNTAYLAMEFLRGSTLLQAIETRGRFSQHETLQIAAQLCNALETVHRAGRLHRDLKPDNIILCHDGRAVIVDFGLSTRFVGDDAYGTRQLDDSQRFGTPGYAPLEQYTQSGHVSEATDIYALGATLYHAFTGQAPPPATDRAFGAKLEAPQRLHGASTPVGDALLWALRMKPAARPPSVRAFADRLFAPDDIASARAELIEVLAARARTRGQHKLQNQTAARRASTPASANPTRAMTGRIVTTPRQVQHPDTSPQPQDDDSSCFQFAFIAYLMVWLLAAMICAGAFFARMVMFGW
jgi:F-box protein 11